MKHLWMGFALLAWAACGDGKKEATEKLAEMDRAATSEPASNEYLLDLAPFDLPLSVSMPGSTVPDADSTYGGAQWNDDTGQMLVKSGDRFSLTISEAPGDLPRLKAALERDMLRKHTVLEETPQMLIYRQQFPDDDLVFVHFYQIIVVGGRSFVVESDPQGRFNETDVRRMTQAVRPNVIS